jgi:hypothetical protein
MDKATVAEIVALPLSARIALGLALLEANPPIGRVLLEHAVGEVRMLEERIEILKMSVEK